MGEQSLDSKTTLILTANTKDVNVDAILAEKINENLADASVGPGIPASYVSELTEESLEPVIGKWGAIDGIKGVEASGVVVSFNIPTLTAEMISEAMHAVNEALRDDEQDIEFTMADFMVGGE